jgi:predicted nuclease with TOPRIM domain
VYSAGTPASRNSHGSSVSRIQRSGGGNQTPAFVAPSSDVETFETLRQQLANFNINTAIQTAVRAEVDRLNAELENTQARVSELEEDVDRLENEKETLRQSNDDMKELLRKCNAQVVLLADMTKNWGLHF